MSRKISYIDEPIRAEIVTDFLPPPEPLVMNEDGIKITIALSRNSVDVIASAAKQSSALFFQSFLDCHVASLLSVNRKHSPHPGSWSVCSFSHSETGSSQCSGSSSAAQRRSRQDKPLVTRRPALSRLQRTVA